MKKIIIRTFSLQDVLDNDKILYNVNNLYEKQPDDYWTRRVYTGDWISLFHKEWHTLVFDKQELEWMKQAKNVSQIRFGFPRIFTEELA